MKLYHVTTPRKAKKYRETGCILAPVRGFNNLTAAMAWAIKANRTVILEFEADKPYKLPDHHNKWGEAWWNDGDVKDYKCVYSKEDEELKKIEQKPTWSEEDEKIGKELIDFCIKCSQGSTVVNSQDDFTRWSTWLGSLKGKVQPQNTWKPSDEQMRVLSIYADQNNKDGSILTSLYQDLKKKL